MMEVVTFHPAWDKKMFYAGTYLDRFILRKIAFFHLRVKHCLDIIGREKTVGQDNLLLNIFHTKNIVAETHDLFLLYAGLKPRTSRTKHRISSKTLL